MPGITLNGQNVEVKAGQMVLEVARRSGVFIPTLCHHPGLGPYGACRLCLVEIKEGLRAGLSASCALPAVDGLMVETDSPLVRDGRKLVAELLLARAPASREILAIAQSLGVESTDFPKKNELCILCGRCVRACKALGVHAISFVERGARRHVAVPFDKPSAQCMACQACVAVCPTGAIKARVTPTDVEMLEWRTLQPLQRCTVCGEPFVTGRQQARVDGIVNACQHQPRGGLCPRCRRRETARDVASIPDCAYRDTHP
jgi:bidirectional [NiFe] hydrogenase diaphorase subunit